MKRLLTSALLLLVGTVTAAFAQAPVLSVSCEWGVFQFTGTADPAVALTAVRDAVNPATMSFSWNADPVAPATSIADYRYGWDLVDPNDDSDPGWTQWGPTWYIDPVSFYSGVHTFNVEARDNLGVVTRGSFIITIEVGPVSTEQTTWGAIKSMYR
jgi:hypothetical protein